MKLLFGLLSTGVLVADAVPTQLVGPLFQKIYINFVLHLFFIFSIIASFILRFWQYFYFVAWSNSRLQIRNWLFVNSKFQINFFQFRPNLISGPTIFNFAIRFLSSRKNVLNFWTKMLILHEVCGGCPSLNRWFFTSVGDGF